MQRGPTRPLMTGCILYLLLLAGLFLLSDFLFLQIALIVLLVLSASFCAWLAGKESHHLPPLLSSRAFCIGALVPILLAAIGVCSVMQDYRALQVTEETAVSVSGVVDRVYYASDNGASFLLKLDQMDGRRQNGKIRVQSDGRDDYANEGERIACTVVLGIEDRTEEYSENILYAFPDGIYAYADVQGGIEMQGSAFSVHVLFDRIAAWCRQRFYQYLPEEAAELCIGVLLGDKSVLSAELRRDFRRVGVSHILAVSGMHLSILLNGMLYGMMKMGIGMRKRYAAALVFIVFFMGITGFSPSVIRAGIMWMLICIAHLVHAQTDALTSLFTAAALLCLISPEAIFDVGLLLSVSASGGMILLLPPLKRWFSSRAFWKSTYGKPLRAVIEVMATTLAATIFTMPITLLVFGELSLIAPLSNLLLHIPIAVMLYGSPLFLLLSACAVFAPAAWLLRFPAGVLSGDAALISDLVSWLSHAEHVLIGVRYVFAYVLLVVFILAFLYLFRRTNNLLAAYPIYGLFLISLIISLQIHAAMTRGDAAITYTVNRKNDCIAVVTDGKSMLIDLSDGSYGNTNKAWKELSEQNITELDVFVLTHYHARHVPTLSKLIQNTVVEAIVLPVPLTEDEMQICNSLREIAVHAGIGVQMYRRGEEDICLGEVTLSSFPMTLLDRSVQPVLGLRISAHEEEIVYLGGAAFETAQTDAFTKQREQVLSGCEILFLGIHGPLYKENLPALSAILADDTAIVCANETVRSYLLGEDRAAFSVYSAETDGAVRVILDGKH